MSYPLPSLPRYVCSLGLSFTRTVHKDPIVPSRSCCAPAIRFLLCLSSLRRRPPHAQPSTLNAQRSPPPCAASAVGSSRILPKSGKVRRACVEGSFVQVGLVQVVSPTASLYVRISLPLRISYTFFSHGYALGGACVGVREAFEQGGVDRG